MVSVTEQYDLFPYPERDPADERHRLIAGSPSHPLEMDHFLWSGHRDWSKPLRALFAGGGTGDGLIQLATLLQSADRPYEITYVDLSRAARRIAEARAEMRGLTGISFVTGSLLEAGSLGVFDYIDCCGVLHHLPDPAAGFAALRDALAEGGGMGFMVYAPYGRSGVYPLQEAFNSLFSGLASEERLKRGREVLGRLSDGHPFRTNPNLGDHLQSDAGFYDLLLHGQDRSFSVSELLAVMDDTGWDLVSFTTPALYDLARFASVPEGMPVETQWALAEKLNGAIRTHVGYAACKDGPRRPASGRDLSSVPHLKGVKPGPLAQAVANGRALPVVQGALRTEITLPAGAAAIIAAIDGRRSLAEVAQAARVDPIAFGAVWSRLEAALVPWGLLLYSGLSR